MFFAWINTRIGINIIGLVPKALIEVREICFMSEEATIAIISGLLSVFIAVITALITSKLTIRQEEKKIVYEKREKVYTDLFNLLFLLKDDPYLVYNNPQFLKPLSDLRTHLNLFASQAVLNILEPFYDEAKKTAHSYWGEFGGEEYEKLKQMKLEYGGFTELDIENEEEAYRESHLIDSQFIEDTLSQLVAEMRTDMGVKR